MEDNKKATQDTGQQEKRGLSQPGDDLSDSFAEEEEIRLERWKEKRRRMAEKRRRRLLFHVILTTVLTLTVLVAGIMIAMGKLPAAEKFLKEKLSRVSSEW